MTTAILFYILSLIIFLIISSLIFRHTVKYSYLSPNFVYVVSFFGIIALLIIIFSVYLLFKMEGSSSSFDLETSGGSSIDSGELNF